MLEHFSTRFRLQKISVTSTLFWCLYLMTYVPSVFGLISVCMWLKLRLYVAFDRLYVAKAPSVCGLGSICIYMA